LPRPTRTTWGLAPRLAALAFLFIALTALARPAMAEDRTLRLHYIHTGESISITYKRDGRFIDSALTQLNTFLRDWRRNEPRQMDPRLFDILWNIQQMAGSSEPITVLSAYRAPQTNASLRSRSSGVAENSLHMRGMATDIFIRGVPVARLREIAFRIAGGGVGYYPNSGSPFVHVDTGNIRAWPRPSRDLLVSLFPDGRTAYLPSSGGPLPGYEQALADSQAGRSAAVQVASASSGSSGGVGGLFGMLFGSGGDTESEIAADEDVGVPVAVAAAAPEPAAPAPAPAPAASGDLPGVTTYTNTPAPAAAPAPAPVVEVAAAAPPPPLPRERPDLTPEQRVGMALAALAVTPPTRPADLMLAYAEPAATPTVEAIQASAANTVVASAEPTPAPPAVEEASAAVASLASLRTTQPATEPSLTLAYASAPGPSLEELVSRAELSRPLPAAAPTRSVAAPAPQVAALAPEPARDTVATAAPAEVRTGAPVFDGSVSAFDAAFAVFAHPNQRDLTRMMAAPVATVAVGFDRGRSVGPATGGFSGSAPAQLIEIIAN
jgi:uncharacterized protein YcbK (DUF882 family)